MLKRKPAPPQPSRAEIERLARQRARVQHLTDPLGAMGFRETGVRVRREAAARRTLFVATVAMVMGGVGIISASALPQAVGSSAAARSAPWVPAPNSVIGAVGMQTAQGVVVAEIPAGIDPESGRPVVVRLIQPPIPAAGDGGAISAPTARPAAKPTKTPRARTRSSR